jgi:hypothetical protein
LVALVVLAALVRGELVDSFVVLGEMNQSVSN